MAVQSIRDEFHTELASTILNDVQRLSSQYYYFLGKTNSWGDGDVPPTSVEPDTNLENTTIRTNSLFYQRIGHNDVSLVCKRHDWVTGRVYPKWDHIVDLTDSAFYVMTDDYNVYKCLDNSSGAISTVKPSGTSYTHFRTSDGYTWKFMYNIPAFKRTKFISPTFIPVQKSLTDSFYDQGSIESMVVTNGGSGYIDAPLTLINVASNTVSGSGATFTLTVAALTGTITSVNITNGGAGYISGVSINISSVYGTGAVLTPIITSGVVTGVTVTNGGFGYQNSDAVIASVGGAVLIPSVSRTTGEIVGVKIVKSGAGYTAAPTLTISVAVGQTAGTGKYNSNPSAIIQAVIDKGSIVRVVIVDPGKNYPVDTATTIVVSGDGKDAAFTPVVSNGELVDVIVENAGVGYTFVQANVVGAGSGATVKAITASSDYVSTQSVVEQTSISGAIYSVTITEQGSNYSPGTTISISGDGSGAYATPVIVDGKIVNVIVNAIGENYTYAAVTVTDPLRNIAPSNSVDASIYVVLSPRKGHGYNAVDELGGDTISIASTLTLSNGLENFNVIQEFRQYGIVKNPTYISSGRTFKKNYDLVAYAVKMSTTVGMVEDEILNASGVKYRLISYNSLTNIAYLQKLSTSPFALGGVIAEAEPTRSYQMLDVTASPSLDKYSGRLLYISDEAPFTLEADHSIQVKTFIKL